MHCTQSKHSSIHEIINTKSSHLSAFCQSGVHSHTAKKNKRMISTKSTDIYLVLNQNTCCPDGRSCWYWSRRAPVDIMWVLVYTSVYNMNRPQNFKLWSKRSTSTRTQRRCLLLSTSIACRSVCAMVKMTLSVQWLKWLVKNAGVARVKVKCPLYSKKDHDNLKRIIYPQLPSRYPYPGWYHAI